jgi:hypothetical protein
MVCVPSAGRAGGRVRPAGEDAQERLALPGGQPLRMCQQDRTQLARSQPFQPFLQRGQEFTQRQRPGAMDRHIITAPLRRRQATGRVCVRRNARGDSTPGAVTDLALRRRYPG